jgi:alpha-L-fucosidase
MTPALAQGLTDIVRSTQPACLIDGRLGAAGDYESTGDNAIPSTGRKGDWETPATINHTWGFKKDDTDWKSPSDIAFKLVDITSKGGNYLLNVGPTSEGIIVQDCQDTLLTVGRWLKVNGEAVYGAKRTPFGAEFGDEAAHETDSKGKPLFLERTDWRCTTKPGKLYFTVFKPTRESRGKRRYMLELPAFKNEIRRAYLLSDRNGSLAVENGPSGRTVMIGTALPDPMANVVCLEIDGDTVQP